MMYGYGYPRLIGSLGFNPLTDIAGLSLYLNKKNATVSSWLDQSPNAYDFIQATGTKQPIISANSVDFDGTDDSLEKTIADVYSGDSSGIIFFSGYFDNTTNNRFLTTCDEATAVNFVFFTVRTSGAIGININKAGVQDLITSTNVVANGAYYYGYIKSNGTSYEINLNGVVETLIIVAGSNSGNWFGDISGRDNIILGSVKTTTQTYYPCKINKVIYSNAALSAAKIADINTFMSDPSN